jgi:hypothetical protein
MKMNKKKKESEKQPLKLWLVEITSKDGKDHKFYVKALTIIDAYRVADEWGIIFEGCPELMKQGFRQLN